MNYNYLESANIAGLYKETVTAPEHCGIGDLNRMMQHSTEQAMERLGISVEDLNQRELLWVICFSQITIGRIPSFGEEVQMFTWPGGEKMGMYIRKYAAFTGSGEQLFEAASLFSLVNSGTRTMVVPSDSGFVMPVVSLAEEPKLPKLTARGAEPDKEKTYMAKEQEIDYNGHVNNAFYLDWARDLLEEHAPGSSGHVGNIWIGYSKEILKGDLVTMKYSLDNQELFLRGYVNSESCFTIKCY